MKLEEYLRSIPEWQDEVQARNMMASFSKPRAVNPEAYDARIIFWERLLVDCVRRQLISSSVLCLPSSDVVSSAFSRRGIRPLGLARVMAHMVACGKASPFIAAGNDSTASAVEESLLAKLARLALVEPVRAGWRFLSATPSEEDLVDGPTDEPVGPLLIRCLVEECADIFLTYMKRSPETITGLQSLEEFVKVINVSRREVDLPVIIDKEDVRILLGHLKKIGAIALVVDDDGESYVKYSPEASSCQISTDEICEYKLRRLLERLERQLKDLSHQMSSLRASARDHLRRGDRSFALLDLKRSKALESVRQSRMNVISNLHEVVSKIDTAKLDIQSFEAYQIGNATLRSIFQENRITAQSVDEIVASLQEALDQQNEISSAVAQELASVQIDEEELEQELEDLAIKQASALLQNAPSVPSGLVPLTLDKVDAKELSEERLLPEQL